MNGTSLVRTFADLDRTCLDEAGGKAANLGELVRAGLPVPPGFVVTTAAYREVAATAGLEPTLAALAETPVTDTERLAKLACEARERLLSSAIPDATAEAILAGYRELGNDVPVAVRSSATAEDLPSASFAGQQDTYLNIVGADALLDAVRRCWASLWTDRAVAYRATNDVDHDLVALAVVVQLMVDAEVAGVLFTADPVTGRRRQAVIDASPGLGEAVVSGAVNPDHFVVDTATGEILERRLGDKRLAIRSLPGGGTEHVAVEANEACLTDDQIRALARLGDETEHHFQAPQDTEWAIDATGKLWLTQARPVTTLFPLPDPLPSTAKDDVRVYFCGSVAQGLTRPLTPSGLAAFRLVGTSIAELAGIVVADRLAGPPAIVVAGQRLFFDFTPILRNEDARSIVPRIFDVMEARSAVIARTLADDPRYAAEQGSGWRLRRRLFRVARRLRAPGTLLAAVIDPRTGHRHAARLTTLMARRTAVPPNASPRERLEHVERILGETMLPTGARVMPAAGAGFLLLGLVAKLLGKKLASGDLEAVLRSLPRNVTTEMDLELWQLAQRIRSEPAAATLFTRKTPVELAALFGDGALPAIAQDGLAEFLRTYGHRAVAEIDLGMPRWSDDPTHLLGVLANYLRLDDEALAPDRLFARGAVEAEAAVARLVAKAGLAKPVVRFALRRVRALAGLREYPKYLIVLALAAARRELAMIGRDLVAAERLAVPDDVFFLDLAEVRSALGGRDHRALVVERREAYAAELRRRRIPRMMLSDGTDLEALGTAATEGDLVGTSASSGTVTGIARVVLDPVGAHLEPGEILVAPSTDPGWTPLFLTAGGLVMEMGGANSHGAVVAREYGIPAVVGVPDATSRISSGQQIRVDGASGIVTISS
ncbi:PEP/pyruvate-binding domain-containing protein [Tenggerimyces flavus]|uniref:PEP/pyruvate-binding domain-containing protein n=1 Tax=Tenggerimyces flavus TaxID=1708749 RepID=A0ABV7Y880_9ACTN|nr:PEP/pyruvate-binding domain-containing protein [Tenggerimyces flavus]MBM7786603.1 pyruvate,water dikinase [Tenggerimyces flavus]